MTQKSGSSNSPWWREAVKQFDRVVSPPANRFVRTNLFTDSVAALTRLEAQARRRIEQQTTTAMHLLNLPTATDVRKMRGQLASVEVRLRDLSEQLEDQRNGTARGAKKE